MSRTVQRTAFPLGVEVIDARERDLDVGDAAVRPDDPFLERRHGVAGQQALEAGR